MKKKQLELRVPSHEMTSEFMGIMQEGGKKSHLRRLFKPYMETNKNINGFISIFLCMACLHFNSNVCNWLFRTFKLQKDNQILKFVCFLSVVKSSDLQGLKWMCYRFQVTKEDVLQYKPNFFQHLYIFSNLNVLKWLTKYFGISKNEMVNADILEMICLKKRFDVLEYFFNENILTLSEDHKILDILPTQLKKKLLINHQYI